MQQSYRAPSQLRVFTAFQAAPLPTELQGPVTAQGVYSIPSSSATNRATGPRHSSGSVYSIPSSSATNRATGPRHSSGCLQHSKQLRYQQSYRAPSQLRVFTAIYLLSELLELMRLLEILNDFKPTLETSALTPSNLTCLTASSRPVSWSKHR